MQLGGAPRCAKCGKAAYAAEQVMGPARLIYHKPCLTCTSCSRRLDALSLVEHDAQPFCKRCHAMQFGTRDLRSANVYQGDQGSPRRSDSPGKVLGGVVAGPWSNSGGTSEAMMGSPVRRAGTLAQEAPPRHAMLRGPLMDEDAAVDDPGTEYGISGSRDAPDDLVPFRVTARRPLPTIPSLSSTSTSASTAHLPTTPDKYAFSSPPITTPRPPPTTEKKGVGVYRASPAAGGGGGAGLGGVGGNKDACEGCGKTVYFAEQINALSHKWHRGCLRCTSCRTTVDPGRVADRDGRPYCKNCYGKEFGPVGLLGKR